MIKLITGDGRVIFPSSPLKSITNLKITGNNAGVASVSEANSFLGFSGLIFQLKDNSWYLPKNPRFNKNPDAPTFGLTNTVWHNNTYYASSWRQLMGVQSNYQTAEPFRFYSSKLFFELLDNTVSIDILANPNYFTGYWASWNATNEAYIMSYNPSRLFTTFNLINSAQPQYGTPTAGYGYSPKSFLDASVPNYNDGRFDVGFKINSIDTSKIKAVYLRPYSYNNYSATAGVNGGPIVYQNNAQYRTKNLRFTIERGDEIKDFDIQTEDEYSLFTTKTDLEKCGYFYGIDLEAEKIVKTYFTEIREAILNGKCVLPLDK